VVYGVVCPQDSIHQVRLMRSFVCRENVPWYAHKEDSIFYLEAHVFLESRSPSGVILQRTEMEKVELPERDPGTFLSWPNFVYQCKRKDLIDPDDDIEGLRYALTIYIPEYSQAIYAVSLVPPLPPKRQIKPTPGSKPFVLKLHANEPIKFSWPRSAKHYIEFETRVKFSERRGDDWTEESVSHYRRFNYWDRKPDHTYEEILIADDWFYPMLGGKIPDDPAVNMRKFKSIDFFLKTSEADFFDYFAFGHYLTDLSENTFTNVVNGIGIFVGYNMLSWEGYTIDDLSRYTLAKGKHTGHLKFSRWE